LQTVSDRAAESGASERTQRMAVKVAKADAERVRQVGHGTVSLPKTLAQVEGKPTVATPRERDDGPSPGQTRSPTADEHAESAMAPTEN
jgi:hypothetical protein